MQIAYPFDVSQQADYFPLKTSDTSVVFLSIV